MIKNYFLLILFFLTGCSSIEQTVYLQNVDVNGPLNNPPIYITTNNSGIQLSPKLSINSINQIAGNLKHSDVNSFGIYQVDTVFSNGKISYFGQSKANIYKYNQNNIKWNLPSVSAALDVDLPVSKAISFFGSINYSSGENYNLTGGSFGIGFKNVTNEYAVRFNLGCTIQEYQYDAFTVVVSDVNQYLGEKFTRVDFYHDVDKKSNLDMFFNFTFNTIIPDFPVNFYCSLAWFSQTILDFSPKTMDLYYYYNIGYDIGNSNLNIESSSKFISITPGVYMNLNPLMRLVLGVNILWNTGGLTVVHDQSSSNCFLMPLVKFDFMF